MGMNFGFGFSENIKSIVNSFVRNEKGEGTTGPNKANKTNAVAKPNAAAQMDAFKPLAESLDTPTMPMQEENIDFRAETQSACDWAAGQSLAEAVDHFENPQVGNYLMLDSLLPGICKRRTNGNPI